MNCSNCEAPGATVNEDAVFWLGRKAAEEEALCEACNERAYDRYQESLMESGGPVPLSEQMEAARRFK